jgi:hypothetical protein
MVAAVLGVVALLAIVLITAGGDDGKKSSSKTDRAARTGAASKKTKAGDGGSASGGSATPATPADPGTQSGAGGSGAGAAGGSGSGATPAAGTPEAAVNDFYRAAARHDYAAAWAMATPRAQRVLGGYAGFARGQSTLRSISFPTLRSTTNGDSANVVLRSQAVHTNRIDRCRGSVDVVRTGGAWKLDDFHIASCAKSPRP